MELSEEILVKDDHYDESDIQVLEGLEAVRKRPGMYIGTTSSAGLHHLVWEIVDNGIDEALAGFATCIQVIVDENNIVTVKDDGRGVPTGVHEKTGKSTVETIYTVLHAGGKFGGGAYKVSGGLHGVGASVVNALSEFLEVEIERDGNKYFQRFENGGTPVGDLQIIGTSDKHGTTVRFKADPEIFTETTVYNHGTLKHRLQELAFLNKGIKIIFDDLRENETAHEEFFYEGGIQEYVRYLTEEKEVILENPLYMEGKRTVEVNHTDMDIMVEISIQYTRDFDTKKPLSFCNNINTAEGGSHIDGFNNALNNALNEYFRNQYLKNAKSKETEESLTGDDIREGMVAIVSVKHPDPQYEGQTKSKLGSSEVRNVVYRVMKENLDRFLMENPNSAREIIEKAMLARNGRIAAKKAKELVKRKGLLDEGFSTLLGKLADCTSRNPEECEIYIVEGDSAGGSAKEGRDRKTQAILPLRGKILNVQKANINRIYDNNEIKTMVTAFGCGVGDNIDLDKLRYHKVVIMTDADVDGAHIRILLLTFFFKFLRPMVEEGYVYFAQPPLYKIEKNKNVKYAYSDDEMERVRKEMGTGCSLQRYKGLGEMNKDQLWETTMNPENRTLVKVNVDDAEQACEIFEMLMGDEVDPRKNFIMENAQFVKNLDI